MVIVLMLAPSPGLALEDPQDFGRFRVRVEGSRDPERIAAGFKETGPGEFESAERSLVRVDRVRALAAGEVAGDWDEKFSRMLGYAAGRGWYEEAAGTIQAHCELPP
jgi:hypothetical protein